MTLQRLPIVQEPRWLLTVAVAFDGARGVVKRGSHVLLQTTPRVYRMQRLRLRNGSTPTKIAMR